MNCLPASDGATGIVTDRAFNWPGGLKNQRLAQDEAPARVRSWQVLLNWHLAAPTKPAAEVSALAELIQTPAISDALQWFSREKKWIQERHLELCRIPAPTFHEKKRAEWMLALLRSLGWSARIDRTGNVIAQLNERRDGPLVE